MHPTVLLRVQTWMTLQCIRGKKALSLTHWTLIWRLYSAQIEFLFLVHPLQQSPHQRPPSQPHLHPPVLLAGPTLPCDADRQRTLASNLRLHALFAPPFYADTRLTYRLRVHLQSHDLIVQPMNVSAQSAIASTTPAAHAQYLIQPSLLHMIDESARMAC